MWLFLYFSCLSLQVFFKLKIFIFTSGNFISTIPSNINSSLFLFLFLSWTPNSQMLILLLIASILPNFSFIFSTPLQFLASLWESASIKFFNILVHLAVAPVLLSTSSIVLCISTTIFFTHNISIWFFCYIVLLLFHIANISLSFHRVYNVHFESCSICCQTYSFNGP